MMMNQWRPGIGTSVKMLNDGAMDLPLATLTSFMSHSGRFWPSYGDVPGPPGKVALPVELTVW